MPHKRNPVLTENLCGLARVVRAAVVPALENVALWHERDISHSSVERMIVPDATATLAFMLERSRGVIEKLVVYPDKLARTSSAPAACGRARASCSRWSRRASPRQDGYVLVQRNAMKAWQEGGDFQSLLAADPEVRKYLSEAEIAANFDLGYHFKAVDTIFARVFGAA